MTLIVGGSILLPSVTHGADRPPQTSDAGSQTPPLAVPGSLCGPTTLHCEPPTIETWPQDTPIPPGYHWSSRPRYAAVGLGSGLMGGPLLVHAAILSVAQASDVPDSRLLWLVVPIAGPFIELSNASSALASAVLVADGVLQAVGLGLIVYGSAWQVPILVRDDMGSIRVVPTPVVLGKTGGGLGLVGSF